MTDSIFKRMGAVIGNAIKANQADLQAQINNKVDANRVLTDVPAGALFTDTIYVHPETHNISQIDGLQAILDNKVNNSRILTDVPLGAVFTDTIYVHPTTHSITEVAGLQTALNNKVDVSKVLTDVPVGAIFTDTTYSDATTVVSGLMSFTDKTKLDGIEAGATGDQTASEILTLLKTVDGVGSGLDADYLNGHPGSYYTEYVDSKVATLVASSPATLDTLNELATALGNDPNFATTVATQIGTKLDTSAYTASDVLNKIKTVDGTTSGLDADMLDGYHASYFQPAGSYGLTTNPLSQFAATTSSQLASVISDETGSGSLVFATSPTLVTPNIGVATGTSFNGITGSSANLPLALGSASAGTSTTVSRGDHVHPAPSLDTLSNVTITSNTAGEILKWSGTTWVNNTLSEAGIQPAGSYAVTTGSLAQFAATTSAQLYSVISDETGSGALVFATSPTLVTPNIGVATGTSFNNITGLSSTAPAALGTAAVGTGVTVARADHVHAMPSLDTLSNVTITSNTAGEILRWNGSTWLNATLAEAGIQPAGSYLTTNQSITLSGDVSGTGSTAITVTLANSGVTAGTYITTTVDAKGRVTAGTNSLGTPSSGNLSNCTVDGTVSVGYRNVPWSGAADKTTTYTLTTSDIGKFVSLGVNGAITIPTGVFSSGDVISLFNNTTAAITITCSATTTYVAGINTVRTSVSLATRGMCTVFFYNSSNCIISGNVL